MRQWREGARFLLCQKRRALTRTLELEVTPSSLQMESGHEIIFFVCVTLKGRDCRRNGQEPTTRTCPLPSPGGAPFTRGGHRGSAPTGPLSQALLQLELDGLPPPLLGSQRVLKTSSLRKDRRLLCPDPTRQQSTEESAHFSESSRLGFSPLMSS